MGRKPRKSVITFDGRGWTLSFPGRYFYFLPVLLLQLWLLHGRAVTPWVETTSFPTYMAEIAGVSRTYTSLKRFSVTILGWESAVGRFLENPAIQDLITSLSLLICSPLCKTRDIQSEVFIGVIADLTALHTWKKKSGSLCQVFFLSDRQTHFPEITIDARFRIGKLREYFCNSVTQCYKKKQCTSTTNCTHGRA